jgi:HK97 gp10 family phage protein
MTVTITGVPHLRATLNVYVSSLNGFFATEFRTIGEEMVQQMQAKAPVDTGFLRDSIRVQEASAERLTVVSEAEYSAYVEFGTYKMSAQPFFFDIVHAMIPSRLITDFQTKVKFE